jgi:hypothetical protein
MDRLETVRLGQRLVVFSLLSVLFYRFIAYPRCSLQGLNVRLYNN